MKYFWVLFALFTSVPATALAAQNTAPTSFISGIDRYLEQLYQH